ncbi:hypothetical protein [Streptomyces sp. NRRL F-5630]|nr:hypothetical protein [Streptomyces sp. NRRL F-5630]
MSRMTRKSHELRWFCSCCSIDSSRSPVVKHMAKRREERRWIREAREETK